MNMVKLMREKNCFNTTEVIDNGQTLTQINISDMSPRELTLQDMIALLEKVLDFEVNQVYKGRNTNS